MLNTIHVGAKLMKADAPDYILEIMELRTLEGELPHAKTHVRTARFDLGLRLYSVSALEDPHFFLPASDSVTHN